MKPLWSNPELCLLLAAVWFGSAQAQVPEFATVQAAHASAYAALLDRSGQVLARRRVDFQENRLDWVALRDISPALPEAVEFAEDRDFPNHHGIDWGAAARATWQYIRGDRSRGASTISMQLAGLLEPSLAWHRGGRSLGEKWRQMRYARELETHWSKDQILEAYFNLVQFRGDLGGVAAASEALFGKQPGGLNRDEALLLAALLPAPDASPAQVARHACTLIKAGFGNASCEHVQELAATTLNRRRIPFDEQPELSAMAWRYLSPQQRHVSTTLDAGLQAFVLERLRSQLASLSEDNVNAGAVLVLDNATGGVLAYVANAGLNEEGRFVDGITARRQAGSTLKPFLYELALEKKLLTAASLLDDSPISLPTPQGLYSPQNYEKDFKGLVTARSALASSLNVPAVRVQLLVGADDFWARLQDLGFDGLDKGPEFYGYGLALGDADVNLWNLANAYRTLARGGQWSPAHVLATLPEVETATPVMNPQASFIVGDMLSDSRARALTFGFENPLATPFWSAVKTGTSKDMRDNWCIGFSQRYTVATWVGNLNGAPMRDVSGITGAAPVWAEVMDRLEGGQWHMPYPRPQPPEGLVRETVNFSGSHEAARSEWFLPGTELTAVNYAPSLAAHITQPVNETIYAIDPDIPRGHQRIRFSAQTPATHLSWWLNEQRLGPASAIDWAPRPGHFRLSLRDDSGQEQDAVVFTVRGQIPKGGL